MTNSPVPPIPVSTRRTAALAAVVVCRIAGGLGCAAHVAVSHIERRPPCGLLPAPTRQCRSCVCAAGAGESDGPGCRPPRGKSRRAAGRRPVPDVRKPPEVSDLSGLWGRQKRGGAFALGPAYLMCGTCATTRAARSPPPVRRTAESTRAPGCGGSATRRTGRAWPKARSAARAG